MSGLAHQAPGSAPGLLAQWGGLSAAQWAGRFGLATVELHARVGSTNDRARALVREGRPLPALVVACRQSGGRGRRGRRWESDSPLGLWFTVALAGRRHGPSDPVSLRAGLAAALAVESVAPGLAIRIKWPNDLMAGARKLGGVLCERAGKAVVAGIGLNLGHRPADLPEAIFARATSVRIETGRPVRRGPVLQAVLRRLEVLQRPAPVIPPPELAQLEARSFLAGRRLSVSGLVRTSSGAKRKVEALPALAGSLRPGGELEVRAEDGETLHLVAGTVESTSPAPGPAPEGDRL